MVLEERAGIGHGGGCRAAARRSGGRLPARADDFQPRPPALFLGADRDRPGARPAPPGGRRRPGGRKSSSPKRVAPSPPDSTSTPARPGPRIGRSAATTWRTCSPGNTRRPKRGSRARARRRGRREPRVARSVARASKGRSNGRMAKAPGNAPARLGRQWRRGRPATRPKRRRPSRAPSECHSRDARPQHWAATQNDLGEVLLAQGKAAEALAAFRAALEVRQKRFLPGPWIETRRQPGARPRSLPRPPAGSGGRRGPRSAPWVSG